MNKKKTGKSTNGRGRLVSNKQKNLRQKEKIFNEVEKGLNTEKYKRKRAKKRGDAILRGVVVVILVAIIAVASLFVVRMNENGWTVGGLVATILGHDSKTLSNLSRVNILVIGQSQNLTDTILVCTYDPKTQDVGMLSIPRDTFVGKSKKNASASDKINAIYQSDPNKLLQKVNEITNLNIQYFVKVDTKGFRDLIDSIGGIYFDVPIDMDYDDITQDLHIHLKAGYQLLDGDKAEQAVRFRHNNDGTTYPLEYGEQDLGRMKTQRAFITEVIKQLAKPENITKVDQYIRIASENVETNFDIWNLKDYAPYALDLKTDNIKTETLPGTPEKINSIWFYEYNKKQTSEVVKKIFKTELTVSQEKNANVRVSILNGTDSNKNLENLVSLLKESGYTIVSTGTTTGTKTTAIVNRTNQTDEVSNKLKDVIGVGIVSNSTSTKADVDFTIIIGEDY